VAYFDSGGGLSREKRGGNSYQGDKGQCLIGPGISVRWRSHSGERRGMNP